MRAIGCVALRRICRRLTPSKWEIRRLDQRCAVVGDSPEVRSLHVRWQRVRGRRSPRPGLGVRACVVSRRTWLVRELDIWWVACGGQESESAAGRVPMRPGRRFQIRLWGHEPNGSSAQVRTQPVTLVPYRRSGACTAAEMAAGGWLGERCEEQQRTGRGTNGGMTPLPTSCSARRTQGSRRTWISRTTS